MKIVLPSLHVRRSAQAIPLSAGCLVAALPARYREESILLNFYPEDSDDDILKAILGEQPQMVAFSVYSWNHQRVASLAKQLRQAVPSLLLVAGGPEVTGNPSAFVSEARWDALVHGEGEQAFATIVSTFSGRHDPEPIRGVTWHPGDHVSFAKADHPADINRFLSPWLSGVLKPSEEGGVLWEVARGCAFGCDYCFESRGLEGVRTFDQKRLIAELELFKKLGVSQVWVLDSTFNYPPERGIGLLELLIRYAPDLHYHLEAKTDYVDRHTASLLSQLSCSVQLGVQSMQKQVLKTVHRPLDLAQLKESVHLLEAFQVTFGFDLIYGLPNDNYLGFTQSLDETLSYSPNHVHIFPLSVLPGTRLARQAKQYNLVWQNHPPYEIRSSMTWSPEDLDHAKLLAAIVDLFYNTGRAVAFFPTLIHTLNISPTAFFEGFIRWAIAQPDIDKDLLLNTDYWSAADVYRLQQGYLEACLRQAGMGYLVSAVLDLLCYHFHYAETLLGEELPPGPEAFLSEVDCWEVPWQRARQIQMVPFAYEIFDLLEMEELELKEFASLFRPVGSVAIFWRRNNDVVCESLGEDFLRLLKNCDGLRTPKEIFAGSVPAETGREMVEFAVVEGLLQPPVSSLAS
ncbi:MAG: DUF4080 domain-containing protein [Deltaproteobacteria bacterium]|jgi:radical SAM superfamily enzyme YgiQ (UPF0313 family)|nr:DUF4080 domain-containing protein [Deltaproteobacteria bacterium]